MNASDQLISYRKRKRVIIELEKTLRIPEFGRCILDMIELRMIPGLMVGVDVNSEVKINMRKGEIKGKLELMILYQNYLGELGFRGFSTREQYWVVQHMRVAFRIFMILLLVQKDNANLKEMIQNVKNSCNLFVREEITHFVY